MKKYFILISILLVMSCVYSQSYTTIVNETFSSTPTGWTVITSSSATWSRDTNYYLSSPSSYKGNVPSSSSAGDTVVLISPIFDLSQYPYVFLRFSHICKVSIADKCQISIKENYTGSQWHAIPASCYLGSANNYSKERKFSDDSYNDWRSDSLWLQPTNGWWKTENFDITSEANYAPVQFKFTITKGSTVGTEFAAGWFIDNFELFASMNQIRPPVVEFIAPLISDTVNHTGPFTINAKVATRTNLPIIQPKLELVYTYGGNVSYDTLLMTNVDGDSLWRAEIPQTLFGTNVKYTINASDSGGNKSFATGEFYVKRIGIGDSNSVAIASIDYPNQLVVGGQSTPVVVTITNKGLKALDSCVLNWSLNGVLQTPYKWRGYLDDDHSAQDTIGFYSPRQNTYDTIIVWVGMPNGVVDTNTFDDTARVYTYGCITILSGEYIVGSSSGANFMNLSTAVNALGGCGSSGNVIFKLESETLAENVDLRNFRSLLGPNDTLTITSLSGNAQDAVIKPLNGSAFTIGKSDNIIIKNITIDVSSATSTISHGIYFVDTCTNIWIDSCVIIAKNVTDTGYDCIHQLTTIGCLTDIYIMNNTLIDGFHGVYLAGPSKRNINVNICNNNVNSFLVGIRLRQTNFTNINNNYVTRNSNTARWCHGIMFIGPCFGKELCNNRINISGAGGPPQASWSSAGLSFYSGNTQGASATNRLLVANNEIIITASTGSNGQAAKGIYCSSAPTHTDFLHNSVLMLGSTSGTATASPLCLDIVNGTNLANKATIYNNNFINLSGIATATKNYAIQLPASNVGFVRDYNNYYSVGPNCVGTRSAGYASIQAWVAAFYMDSNSVSVLPDSITAASTDLRVEGSQILCPALSLVTNDIENNPRIVTTNMGCYHTNLPSQYDAGIAQLSFSRTFADSVYPTVLVSVLNMGYQTLDSVEIHWSVNGVAQPTYMWYGSLGRGQASPNVNIGMFMVRKGINNIVVYTSRPNGQPLDADHSNDTASYQEFACGLPLVGTYTIGGLQADFIDEKEMMQAVSDCGVGGTVVFEFLSGTYGDLSFSNYPIASGSMDSIIITSAAGHPDSVVFKSSGAAALSIGNIANFIFKHVTFDATTTGDNAVRFMNPMNNIKFYDCNIYANPTAVTSGYAGVYYNGLSGQINDISFIKNRISGGYYNVYLNTPSANRMILDSNELTNAAAYGFYGYNNANFKRFSNNRIVSRSNTTINYTGFYMYRSKIDTMVCNKVHVTTTATAYGFNMYMQINISISPAFIANNEIILNGNTCYGFYGSTSGSSGAVFSRIDYFNNSIYAKGNAAYGIYLNEFSGMNDMTPHRSTFKYNNIYASSTSGGASYAYFLASTTAIPFYKFDYNNYYSTGTNLVRVTTDCITIADIIATGTGNDSNSININPMFPANPVNLSPSAMLRCPLVPYITHDIQNELRTLSNNSMGCYAKFFSADAGLDTFFMPTPISFIGIQNSVVVRLKNYGIDTLQNATIQWTLDGTLQTPFNATNLNLSQYEDTVLTIGSFIPSIAGNINVVAWTEIVGDGNTLNDTIKITTYACDSMLNGNYTIGASGRDFSSINDAISALLNCGVSGPVVFSIDSGTYAPIDISRTFFGANDTNIVTFTSASSNANDVKIVSSSTAVMLTDAGYLNFNHLTIDASSASIPSAIKILSSANNIEFSNCTIKAMVMQTELEKNDVGAIHSQDITSAINNLRILNNHIDGGYFNVSLQAGKNLAYGTDIVIDNNVMTNAFYAGINIIYAEVNSISNNRITANNSNAKSFIGVYLAYCEAYLNANRIRTLTSMQYFTGIDMYYVNHLGSNHALLSNNEIIATATTTNNYGIKVNQMSYVDVINNSIYLNSAGARCLEFNSPTSNIMLKNNNFISAATAYPIYFSSANYAQNSVMDYNNYYSGGNYIAYAGSSVSNMSAWQALTSNDMHSVSILPSFVNINTDLSLTNSNNSGLVCPIDSNVTTDINDSARVLYTYMGAYTAAVFAGNDLEILSVVEPVNKPEVICHQNFASVKVAIKNQGGYLFDFDTNNVRLYVNVTGAINFQKDTLLTTGTLDILATDIIEITNLLPVSQNGTYHITAWLESVIDQDASNDTTSTDFTVDLLTLPYNENFSTVPSTFTFSQLTGSAGWSVQQGQGTNPVINPVNGSGRLTFASELGAIASARLQPINLLGARNPKLEFWYAHDDNNSSKDDKLFVRVSVDGGSTYQNLAEIKRYNSVYTTPTFVYYTYDLSSYSTYACVIIDFYGQSFGGGNQNIDSISITSLQDIEVALDIIPQNDFVACDLDQKSISAIITNVTTQEFQFDRNPSELVVEVSGATTKSYTHPLVTGSISGNAYMTVVLDTNFDFSTNGTYNFKAYIRSADVNTQNDTAVESRVINVDVKMLTLDPLGTIKVGDNFYPTVSFTNTGIIPIRNIPLHLQINKNADVTEIVDSLLNPGDTITYTFVNTSVVPVVAEIQPFFLLEVKSELSCDGNSQNNLVNAYCPVTFEKTIDLLITSIEKPNPSVCDTGKTTVYPIVRIKNQGSAAANNIMLYVTVDSAGTVLTNYSEAVANIDANDSLLHTCVNGYLVPNFTDNYKVTFFVSQAEDLDTTNNKLDVMACAILDDVSMEAFATVNWSMEQNIPNPVSTITSIRYSLPKEGTVQFSVTSISGQILYNREIPCLVGEHVLEFDTQNLANGIYYYRMEYQGQSIVKKMTIQK